MGCDIHFVVERKYGGTWVGLYSSSLSPEMKSYKEPEGTDVFDRSPIMRARNYTFFGLLAGVRCEGPEPKGGPEDASELAQADISKWDCDGHSHSWDTLLDFTQKYLESQYADDEKDKCVVDWVKQKLSGDMGPLCKEVHNLFGLYDDEETQYGEYRVIYWFDN